MTSQDFAVTDSGVRVECSYNDYSELKKVEGIVVTTGEYTMALSEAKDVAYDDIAISLEDFKKLVRALNRILENIEDTSNE